MVIMFIHYYVHCCEQFRVQTSVSCQFVANVCQYKSNNHILSIQAYNFTMNADHTLIEESFTKGHSSSLRNENKESKSIMALPSRKSFVVQS